ncbi:MAG: Stp1/IreP family PP2C-type Ser/Thr phosphatase [Nitrospirae bacterium]|nr:Stp1/IreP family PP2C-type Ser/Thr phosphatase [Nitrospirota bacterium]
MAIFNSPILSSIEGSIKSRLKNIEGRIEKMAIKAIEKKDEENRFLKRGVVINNRYRIEEFVMKMEGCNVYLATDIEGYKRCWGCGHDGNNKEDVFCNHCGVELSARVYQIVEADKNNNFSTEAYFIKKGISHPNMIGIYDRFTLDEREYLVSEYVKGMPLKDKGFDENQIRDYTLSLADMAEYLHSQNVSVSGLEKDDLVIGDGGVKLVNLAGLRLIEGAISHSRRKKDIKHLGSFLKGLIKDTGEDWGITSVLQKAAGGGFSSAGRFKERLEDAKGNVTSGEAIIVEGMTDIGIVRKVNEDSLRITELSINSDSKKANLFVVADGMGGHQSGDVASSMAVEALTEGVMKGMEMQKEANEGALLDFMKMAAANANKAVYNFARENKKDMGTTVVAGLLFADTLYTASVGDSRAYLIRNGEAAQITKDHSLVARLVELNMVDPKDARHHPKSNILLRTIGTDPKVEVDAYKTKVRKGDHLLLCTDGLWNQLADDEMVHIIKKISPQDACREMIRIANERGGHDNITAIVVRINNNL